MLALAGTFLKQLHKWLYICCFNRSRGCRGGNSNLDQSRAEPEYSREGQRFSYLAPVNVANNSTNINYHRQAVVAGKLNSQWKTTSKLDWCYKTIWVIRTIRGISMIYSCARMIALSLDCTHRCTSEWTSFTKWCASSTIFSCKQ